MKNFNELLKDKEFLTALLNGPCKPREQDFSPVRPDWVDDDISAMTTQAFHKLLPDGVPYIPYILAEKNPDTMYDGTCVDANAKRMRYFVVTVIPDTDYPYDCSYPLIHQMWTFSLHCWEICRATLAACTKDMQVRIATDPVPPILNNAVIEWVSLYLGREPYRGISQLSEQWLNREEFDGYEFDVHLYKIREMEKNELLDRLIGAYDAAFPVETDQGV